MKTKFSGSHTDFFFALLLFAPFASASKSHNLVFTGSYATERWHELCKGVQMKKYHEIFGILVFICIVLVVLLGRLLRTFYNKDCIRCGLFLGSLVATFKVCIFWDKFLRYCYKTKLFQPTFLDDCLKSIMNNQKM